MGHRTGCCSLADRCKSPIAIRPRSSHLWRVAIYVRAGAPVCSGWPLTTSTLLPNMRSRTAKRDQEHAEDNGVATDQPGQRQRAGAWLLCQRQRVADTDAYGGRA